MFYKQEKYIVQVDDKTLTCGGFKNNGYNYSMLDNCQIKLFNSKAEAITHIRVVYGVDIDINQFKISKIEATYLTLPTNEGEK